MLFSVRYIEKFGNNTSEARHLERIVRFEWNLAVCLRPHASPCEKLWVTIRLDRHVVLTHSRM